MKTSILIVAASGIGLLPAQTAALSALSPVTVRAQLASQTQTVSAPVGPLAAFQQLHAELGVTGSGSNAVSNLLWSVIQQPWTMSMVLAHHASVASATAASADVISCDLLLQLSNATPIQVQLDLRRWIATPAGVPAPTIRIDVGNDGIFELTESSLVILPVVVGAALGPTPLAVRVQYMGALASPGTIHNTLAIDVTPVGVSFQDAAVGCDPSHQLFAAPTFDGGVIMYVSGFVYVPGFPQELAVIVLGLSAQPVILPSSQWLPCLLIPSPDALVLRLDSSFFTLPIPFAVRPIAIFAQPVIVWPTSLQTGNGMRILAL